MQYAGLSGGGAMHAGIAECEPVEPFIKFILIFSHGAQNLADPVVDFLNENRIPLSNCRGQSYDNASNNYVWTLFWIVSTDPSTVLNEFAIYVPCAGHSPNLLVLKAAEYCLEIVKFFDFVQRLFLFLGFYTSTECSLTSFWEISCRGQASV